MESIINKHIKKYKSEHKMYKITTLSVFEIKVAEFFIGGEVKYMDYHHISQLYDS